MRMMISKRRLLAVSAFAGLTVFLCQSFCLAEDGQKPNILLLMCDDMGWRDPSCFGNDSVTTPNIDRLAKEGKMMTAFYAASAVCTPTRASVLTGKYPLRFDIRKHFNSARGEYLPAGVALPKILQGAGYATVHIGKWHLGGLRLKDCSMRDRSPGPHQHGFDYYLCQREEQPMRGAHLKNRTLYRRGGTCLLRDDKQVGTDDPYYQMYLTDILGEEALQQIRKHDEKKQPFFINLWWLTPHTPSEPAPEPHWSQTAAEGISEDQHRFRSMVARMDYQVGRILDTLDHLGIADDTLVIFLSDNGGAYEANIGPLKGGKTDLHEGGIRVPFLVRWPGRIKANSVSAQLGHSNDLLPTVCNAAGVPLPDNHKFDGIDILPLLTDKIQSLERGTVFWQINLYRHIQRHYPKPKPYATEIARSGHWKMLALNGKPVELFDMEADVREKDNLLNQKPELVEALEKELKAWLAEPRQSFGRIK